jgi:Tfp pilus tip-associated adhesin PilY1
MAAICSATCGASMSTATSPSADPPVYDAQRLATLEVDADGERATDHHQTRTRQGQQPSGGVCRHRPAARPGERVNTDLRLQLSTLAFNTNTPTSGACVPVGVSFAYFLDYRTGSAVEGTDGLVGIKLGDYLSTSPSVIRLEDGTIRELIRTDSPETISAPVPTAPTPLDTRRVSWRELITE